VASAPILSSPADIDPALENTNYNLVYTITATANGPDSYDFSSDDTTTNMDADAGFTTPSATLGGTTVATAIIIGVTNIVVPFDGTDDSIVNGIAVGDTIVIDPSGTAEVRIVDSIDESSGGAGNTVTITLTVATASAHASGLIIGERASVTVVATTDEVTTGASGTHSVLTTATSVADNTQNTTQTTATVITVRRPALVITKYVRNITDTALTGASPITIDTDTWYGTGVTGKPGDVLEYLIVVDNTDPDAAVASNIILTDPIAQFSTFEAGSILLDADGSAANLAAFTAQDETADDGDAAEFDSTGNGTVYVYGGVGGDDSDVGASAGDGGSLAVGEISRVVFQVSID